MTRLGKPVAGTLARARPCRARGRHELARGTRRAGSGGRGGLFGRGGDPDAKRPEDPALRRANTRRILGLFRPYRKPLSLLLGLIAATAAISTIPAFLLRALLDGVFRHPQHIDTTQPRPAGRRDGRASRSSRA